MPSDRHCATASSHAALEKMKTMAGSMVEIVEGFDELAAAGARQARVTQAAGPPGLARHALVERKRLGVDAAVVEQGHQIDATASLLGDRHVMAKSHGTVLLDDDFGGPPHAAHPGAELIAVGHRRRQAHEHHLGSTENEHLLPHRAAVGVLEVVHLVEHDEPEPGELRRAGEEHVAQHLCGHHDHRRVGLMRDVAGEQPYRVGSVHLGQLGELLVRQRLQRCGVEGTLALGARPGHGVVGDHGLPRARGGRDQHRAPVVESVAGGLLEGIEREPKPGHHTGAQGVVVTGRGAHRLRCLNGAGPCRSRSRPRRRHTSARPAPTWRTGPRSG